MRRLCVATMLALTAAGALAALPSADAATARCPVSTKGTVGHVGRVRLYVVSLRTRWGRQPTMYGCMVGGRRWRIDNVGIDRRGRAEFPRRKPTFLLNPELGNSAVVQGPYFAYVQRREYTQELGPTRDDTAGYAVVAVDLRTGRRVFSSGLASANGFISDIAATPHGAVAWIQLIDNGRRVVLAADAAGRRTLDTTAGSATDIGELSLAAAAGSDVVTWTHGLESRSAVLSGRASRATLVAGTSDDHATSR